MAMTVDVAGKLLGAEQTNQSSMFNRDSGYNARSWQSSDFDLSTRHLPFFPAIGENYQ
jgi:hypothetical protein